ncbi:MAG: hypothetical protein ACREEQ_02675, partial [Caulobacteraceae bacterium]
QNAAASMSALLSSEAARIVKTTAETIAWWTFAAIALGAIGGLVGGGLGAIRAPRREYVAPTAP